MAEQLEDEHGAFETESESNPYALSVIGGLAGIVIGSRRSKSAAVVGGVVGGTIGYLAGKAAGVTDTGTGTEADEPVVVTVDDGSVDSDEDDSVAPEGDESSAPDDDDE